MPTLKVLIVEDSPARGEQLAALVQEAGFAVARVGRGQDIVERARAERPDLVLLDLVAPPTDGYEACRELRGDPAVRHIPLIVVAPMPSPLADPLWARLQGASDFTGPEKSPDHLLASIRTALI
jgi:twitching motility two-component system response regulator PilH